MHNFCEVEGLAFNYGSATVHNKAYTALCGSSLQEHQQYLDKHLGKGQHMAAISVQVEQRRTQSETRSDRGLKSADPAQAAAVCWNVSPQVKQGQQRLSNPNDLNSQMFPLISVALLKEHDAAFKGQKQNSESEMCELQQNL